MFIPAVGDELSLRNSYEDILILLERVCYVRDCSLTVNNGFVGRRS
jgi:hypothetical protein